MKKKWSLAAFLPGFIGLTENTQAITLKSMAEQGSDDTLKHIEIAPLHVTTPLYIAGHRSHSSHGSHRSHRSSSGGYRSYSTPSYPSTPSSSSSSSGSSSSSRSDPLGQPATPSYTAPKPSHKQVADRTALIMRVQVGLKIMGYYTGTVDGIMGPATRSAIKDYREEKGLPNGLIDQQLLNALGVAAP
ncbi:His-Xaa-Ser repeat protein HxsA [Marinobacter halodurans]|uniref:His-Xaa-Ser repeat protein HxsA n=1 Tax=Marinobacter halodurans TaxID=2528979 RepID=A0ABY1ZJD3_9GAMM|nr:His-Xaa-Ser repeat protein HxsA [Marinobacter halodurans]TBW49533.1 His-Xaa-Ser repeat protein HxsA [Marinobacter halodurans]